MPSAHRAVLQAAYLPVNGATGFNSGQAVPALSRLSRRCGLLGSENPDYRKSRDTATRCRQILMK
jgi:hypothetical protein